MAVVDIPNKTITLKIVYYGCALGGKTTNLVALHQLTDRDNTNGLVSIATKDDRTLFFDLLPMELGQVGGLAVKVKLYTVPGQMHYEMTRRQVLSGADGVVFVADSSEAERKANLWALENLHYNLRANRLEPEETPMVLQWNKRDVRDARTTADLDGELNTTKLPTVEAVAVEGKGVVETFEEILKRAIYHTYQKSGRTTVSQAAIDTTVEKALRQARHARPKPDAEMQFDQRFDMEAYQDEQAQLGHAKKTVDESSLLAESVRANMALAEGLDGFHRLNQTNDRRKEMMQALGRLAPKLTDPEQAPLERENLQLLLEGAGRTHGSMLLFQRREEVMEERQVLPASWRDLLNGVVNRGLGSLAYRLSKEHDLRRIDDLTTELFYGDPPAEAQDFASVLIAPLRCDGLPFGSLIVYSLLAQPGFDEAETEYWSTASTLLGLSLHWRALRKKVLQPRAS